MKMMESKFHFSPVSVSSLDSKIFSIHQIIDTLLIIKLARAPLKFGSVHI